MIEENCDGKFLGAYTREKKNGINPTVYLTAKGGGVPQTDKIPLTDEQVDRLLAAIKGLPPYVFVMLGLYAGLRREEILALQWDSVYLDTDAPYLTVRRAWHTEHNRPVILMELKTKAAERNIPLPVCLAECLREAKAASISEYVVANRDGEPLSYKIVRTSTDPANGVTVSEMSYKVVQIERNGEIAFAVIYGG